MELPHSGPARSSERRPVLLLDLDDCVCLNSPYGGYDAALALSNQGKGAGGPSPSSDADLWERLFDAKACAYLRRLHDEFVPLYVLSTSWWWILDDDKLREVLVRTGLGFVADNLHVDSATPKGVRPDLRWTEISNWLEVHPEFADRWVVLDDELSGTGLDVGQPDERLAFIVLCKEGQGLTESEYKKCRVAFSLRAQAINKESIFDDDAR